MIQNPDRLYELLPSIYRQRDAEQGYPLRALLQVITEQVDVVEEDIAQLYENWFIETAQDWVVPYIGDLVGYRPSFEAGQPGSLSTAEGQLRNKILVPRREVANLIHARRRKGTLALLEELAQDVAGWPARAVEFFRLLGWTQSINHQRPHQGRTASLRRREALDRLDGPFDSLAHTEDVRRIDAQPGRTHGRYGLLDVGVFVWRLKVFSITRAPAYCLEEAGPQCFTFSVLGNSAPLYNHPQKGGFHPASAGPAEASLKPARPAGELDLPGPIRRLAIEERPDPLSDELPARKQSMASDHYYGMDKSLVIWAPDWPRKGAAQPVPREAVIPADLTDWAYRVQRNFIAVDPELGRIIFPPGQLPKNGVYVSYHYAFSAAIGGGEYDRPLYEPTVVDQDGKLLPVGLYQVCRDQPGCYETINLALQAWNSADPKPLAAVIEIEDSGVYTEPLTISFKAEENLQIRAANRTRPVIRLFDYMAERPDSFSISGEAGSRLTLDGLLVAGRSIQVQGPDVEYDGRDQVVGAGPGLCALTLRHCTLVPGWALDDDCTPKRPGEPSLELINTRAHIRIEHSILGSIQITADDVKQDPMQIELSDSVLDATGVGCDTPECEALGSLSWGLAHAVLTVRRSTVFGSLQVHSIALAENSIFMSPIKVGRRQIGCLRFCYVTPGSRTPRRYHCQPDLGVSVLSDAEKALPGRQAQEELRLRPQFNSTRYGSPTYCQLSEACAVEIRTGAEDEAELGVFHDLFQPQREANLRARLDEYTPAGMDAGILFAS